MMTIRCRYITAGRATSLPVIVAPPPPPTRRRRREGSEPLADRGRDPDQVLLQLGHQAAHVVVGVTYVAFRLGGRLAGPLLRVAQDQCGALLGGAEHRVLRDQLL